MVVSETTLPARGQVLLTLQCLWGALPLLLLTIWQDYCAVHNTALHRKPQRSIAKPSAVPPCRCVDVRSHFSLGFFVPKNI